MLLRRRWCGLGCGCKSQASSWRRMLPDVSMGLICGCLLSVLVMCHSSTQTEAPCSCLKQLRTLARQLASDVCVDTHTHTHICACVGCKQHSALGVGQHMQDDINRLQVTCARATVAPAGSRACSGAGCELLPEGQQTQPWLTDVVHIHGTGAPLTYNIVKFSSRIFAMGMSEIVNLNRESQPDSLFAARRGGHAKRTASAYTPISMPWTSCCIYLCSVL